MDYVALAQAATSLPSLGILSLLSFTESSCFIIPPEVVLIPAAIAAPHAAIWLGVLTTVTSVLGAQFGYWIGLKGGKPLLYKFFSEEKIDKVKIMYHRFDASAILVAAFTPIPFKLATISAGVFDINYKRFLLASIVGRGTRYLLISILLFLYGEPVKHFIEYDLNRFLSIAILASIIFYLGYKYALTSLIKYFASENFFSRILRRFSRFN